MLAWTTSLATGKVLVARWAGPEPLAGFNRLWVAGVSVQAAGRDATGWSHPAPHSPFAAGEIGHLADVLRAKGVQGGPT